METPLFNHASLCRALPPAALVVLGSFACGGRKPSDTQADKQQVEPATKEPADTNPGPEALESGCTVSLTSPAVDGSTLWSDIPDASNPSNCNFHRFAYNNFLYLVGGTVPRFMTELASTTQLATTHSWPDAPTLTTRKINNAAATGLGKTQAGVGFELLDINGQVVRYDIRINKTMWDAIATNQWYDANAQTSAQTAYDADPQTGGIWLPPTAAGDGDSIEIKTSWRIFASSAECPSSLMFCVPDGDGNTLGLLGMHVVQKTAMHGEWIWATFEHVANAPDCQPGFSNPLQHDPRDPTKPSATISVNTGTLADASGWSVFDFSSYGGDGSSCEVSTGTQTGAIACTNPTGTSQCNGYPNPSGDLTNFVPINVCRTAPIPDHSTPTAVASVCASTQDNDSNVACISQSVLDNWPAGLDARWKYYMLVGTEWLDSPSVQTVGCMNMQNTAVSQDSYTCAGTAPSSFSTAGSVHLTNTTMETWMQKDSCIPILGPGADGSLTTLYLGSSDCLNCHNAATIAATQGDFSHVFASL